MTLFLGCAELSRHSRKRHFSRAGDDGGAGACLRSVAAISAAHGSPANFHPGFSAAPLVSILLVLQIVPYFMTGFESVPKAAEEAHQDFRPQGFFRAIVLALLVGAAFYVVAIAAVSVRRAVADVCWESDSPPPLAFRPGHRATQWPVRLILVAAMFGLFQCFNGNFVAASRLLFSFGQARHNSGALWRGSRHVSDAVHRGDRRNGRHARRARFSATRCLFRSPKSVRWPPRAAGSRRASRFFWWNRGFGARLIAAIGALVALLLVAMKLIPKFPGHFSRAEWIALAIWLLIGAAMHWLRPSAACKDFLKRSCILFRADYRSRK